MGPMTSSVTMACCYLTGEYCEQTHRQVLTSGENSPQCKVLYSRFSSLSSSSPGLSLGILVQRDLHIRLPTWDLLVTTDKLSPHTWCYLK